MTEPLAAALPRHLETIRRYEGYLALDPGNPSLISALGDLYHQAGDFESALDCFRRCLAIDPGHAPARSRLANVLISLHRFQEAEDALRPLAEADPANAALWHNLGLSLYYQRRWDEALQSFEQAAAQTAMPPETLRYRTFCLHHLGKLDQALEAARLWLQKVPGTEADGYLALLEMDKGNMLEAYQRAAKVLERHPDNTDAALVAGLWSTEQQDSRKAFAYFQLATRNEPDNPRGWLGLGLVHMYRREYAQAIAALKTALKYMPGHAGTLVTLGWAWFAALDLEQAERTFREAIASEGALSEAHGGLAVILIFQKRIDEARREAEIARRLDPRGFGGLYAKGVLLALDGKQDRGEAIVAAALEQRVTHDGRTALEHIRIFLQQESASLGRSRPGKFLA
jgi:tetratricopeptide (TPR) repeat protein